MCERSVKKKTTEVILFFHITTVVQESAGMSCSTVGPCSVFPSLHLSPKQFFPAHTFTFDEGNTNFTVKNKD